MIPQSVGALVFARDGVVGGSVGFPIVDYRHTLTDAIMVILCTSGPLSRWMR